MLARRSVENASHAAARRPTEGNWPGTSYTIGPGTLNQNGSHLQHGYADRRGYAGLPHACHKMSA
ncbi:hypothetical protein PsYK624_054700 [Phanerochaete sordida]|uniref:Uncharacterized protein n=1 Tax=Phanerochaete sordida TaxID=48140 RepID=A0A9P3G6Z0_9APHY|nr:hypothetical protein PsYK624_054700 [Phanerochaete sordida]